MHYIHPSGLPGPVAQDSKPLPKWWEPPVRNGRWHELLQDAIHETEPKLAEVKIRKAEGIILKTIHNPSVPLTHNDQEALFGALGVLRVMRSVRRISKPWPI